MQKARKALPSWQCQDGLIVPLQWKGQILSKRRTWWGWIQAAMLGVTACLATRDFRGTLE